jgi:hypothetical protein
MKVCDRRTNKRPCGEWVVDVRVPTRSTGSPSQYTANTLTHRHTILLFYWKPLAGTRENGAAGEAAARNRRQPSGASLLVPKLCVLSAVARSFSHMLSKRIYGALFAYPTRRGVRWRRGHQYAYLLRKLGHISLSGERRARARDSQCIEMWAGRLDLHTTWANSETLFSV